MDRRSLSCNSAARCCRRRGDRQHLVPTAAAADPPAHSRDWSHRHPKGAPVVKRFNEQRWVLDNVIQANGIDWDQSHTGVVIGSGGPSTIPEMAELRKRVNAGRYRAGLRGAGQKARGKAKEAEQAGNKTAARDTITLPQLLGVGDVDVDEVDAKIQMQNDKKLENFNKYMAVADHHIEWIELPYRGKTLPAIFHLPPNYQSGTKVPVIVVVSGMDGFKERSVALKNDRFLQRGYAVLAFEGPGYWEPPLRGIYVDVPGWAEAAKTVADWLVKRPELDASKIGMTGVSFGSFFTAIMMSAIHATKPAPSSAPVTSPAARRSSIAHRRPSRSASCSCRASPTSASSTISARRSTGTAMRRNQGRLYRCLRRIRSALPARIHRGFYEGARRAKAASRL